MTPDPTVPRTTAAKRAALRQVWEMSPKGWNLDGIALLDDLDALTDRERALVKALWAARNRLAGIADYLKRQHPENENDQLQATALLVWAAETRALLALEED